MRRPLVVLALVCAFAAGGAEAKGPADLVLVGADGRAATLAGVDIVAGVRASPRRPPGGGYLLVYGFQLYGGERLRYYPAAGVLCSWWPGARPACGRVDPKVARRVGVVRLARFTGPPTVIADLALNGVGQSSWIEIQFELALNSWRAARPASPPRRCLLSYRAAWRGPRSADRPRRLCLLRRGVYAAGRLYPSPPELARIAESVFAPDGSLTGSP